MLRLEVEGFKLSDRFAKGGVRGRHLAASLPTPPEGSGSKDVKVCKI